MLRMLIVALGLALLLPTSASADIKYFCDVQREKLAPYFKTQVDVHRHNIIDDSWKKMLDDCSKIGVDSKKRYELCLFRAKNINKKKPVLPDLGEMLLSVAELKENSLLYGAYCKKF